MLSLMNAAAVRTRAIPAPMLYEYAPHTGGATAVPSPAAPWHLTQLVAYTRAPAAVSAVRAAPFASRLDHGAACPVLRVAREYADPGAARAAAGIQVTAHAPQLVADVPGQALGRRDEQRATAPNRHAERTVGDEGVGRTVRRRVRGRGARAIRATPTREDDRGSQAQGREGVHREADTITLCRVSPLQSLPCNLLAP